MDANDTKACFHHPECVVVFSSYWMNSFKGKCPVCFMLESAQETEQALTNKVTDIANELDELREPSPQKVIDELAKMLDEMIGKNGENCGLCAVPPVGCKPTNGDCCVECFKAEATRRAQGKG
jgi:hypothetical protein